MRLPYQQVFDFHKREPLNQYIQDVPIDTCFPEESANKLALLESYNKHLYRPNTYLHKWWARRSGTTFRYILKQLVAYPELRDFYKGGGLEGKIIFDPMMGGGNTLHEAIRLGANVIGTDIDPIPVLQAKASLIRSPLKDKIDVFKSFQEILKNKLSVFYITECPECKGQSEIQFVLYGLRKKCSCREVLIIDNFLIRKSSDKDIKICPDCHSVYDSRGHNCITKSSKTIINKKEKKCEQCDTPFKEILSEPFPLRYVPLVIVGSCPEHGTFYKSVKHNDNLLFGQAQAEAKKLDFGDPERFKIPYGPKSKDLLRREINSYIELFTARQLIYLNTSLKFLAGLNYEDKLWLALLISTSLEFNSLLCGYKGGDIRRPGAIRHVFSHHAYSFPHTALENNPAFSGNTSGTLNRLFNDRVVKAAKWAVNPTETKISSKGNNKVQVSGEIDAGDTAKDWNDLEDGERKFFILQSDAATLNIPAGIVDYIVTDPPYYDSVQYSDLSNFFRVWLSKFLPNDADWHFNPIDSAVHVSDDSDSGKYCSVLTRIWMMCNHALNRKNGRLIFTFHHWRAEAWSELTCSLKDAGFILVNQYVVFSENPVSVHINGLNSLKHDTILILKPTSVAEESKEWNEPAPINREESYLFCKQCGDALGWFLASDLSKQEILMKWKQLIEGKENG